MKRRKTVSVTPAMGARTVAGEIRTPPTLNEAGNIRATVEMDEGATGVSPATVTGCELSQNLSTV